MYRRKRSERKTLVNDSQSSLKSVPDWGYQEVLGYKLAFMVRHGNNYIGGFAVDVRYNELFTEQGITFFCLLDYILHLHIVSCVDSPISIGNWNSTLRLQFYANYGNHFILETQWASDSCFIQRAIEYASRVYLSQRPKDKKEKNNKGRCMKMRPVIFLAIMEETLFPHREGVGHDAKFEELEINIEKWSYFFKHAENIDPERLKEIIKENLS
ncbi:hypothetical protein H8356DRAFT_1417131 [Neocallimastix lanati (nom. inval.)]|nr:hypothetical protein H8356DRAFT_1417131 [Neocallimastix sp. JGI-2020a]